MEKNLCYLKCLELLQIKVNKDITKDAHSIVKKLKELGTIVVRIVKKMFVIYVCV